ncbi:major capsid protein [Brucella sp. BE17]|uniref:major capsid protein n=1 Tax=Brucella sp. BE17 TaxID=3142977 RepID=UPI0031BAF6D6
MELNNILNSGNELFSKVALTDHVVTQPYVPDLVSKWLPWNSEGVHLPTVAIDFTDGTLDMIPEAVRGAPGDAPERDTDSSVLVKIPHYPQQNTLLATQFEGIRAAGSELLVTVETERNKLLSRFNKRNRLMWEVSRIGAVTGKLLGSKGQVIKNWNKEFSAAQTKVQIDFASANTKLRTELVKAKDKGEDNLGEFTADRWILIAGKDAFPLITDHPNFEKMFERYNDGATLRDDLSDGFKIASNITAVKYTRNKIGGQTIFGDSDMYLVPVVDGMFQTRFGPGTGMGDLGVIGLPEYVSPYDLPHDEGVELKAQTNVISWVQRLQAIVKIEPK